MLPQSVQYRPPLRAPESPHLMKRQKKRDENHAHLRAHHVAQEARAVLLGSGLITSVIGKFVTKDMDETCRADSPLQSQLIFCSKCFKKYV